MIHELSCKVAETIPYRSFEQRIRIVGRELRKGKDVEVWHDLKLIYSARRER